MMTFEGTVTINAPREQVYKFLTDPMKVTQCAPDVQRVEPIDDSRFKVVARAGVGAVKATFTLDVTWLERNPPEWAATRTKGNAPGSAVEMTTSMKLSEVQGSTQLDWKSDVTVSGTIASVGARLLKGAADKTTSQVFDCVKQKLESPAAAVLPAS